MNKSKSSLMSGKGKVPEELSKRDMIPRTPIDPQIL
jgi:hypothetical protein